MYRRRSGQERAPCREAAAGQLALRPRRAARAFAAFLLALASAEEAGASVTADALERHYAGARTQGFVGVFPVAALAEALRRAGREADALALLDGVLDALPHPRRGAFVPELWRCRGEIRARIDPAAAEHDLRVALAIASAQETALYRLRASTALARVLLETGRRAEAAAVLAQAEGANGCDAGHRERGALAELQRAATQRRSATSLP